MFKVGDKVVCINVSFINGSDYYRKAVKHLKLNETYIVVNNDGGACDMELYELPHIFYNKKRFKTIQQIRALKLYNLIKIWKNKLDNTS